MFVIALYLCVCVTHILYIQDVVLGFRCGTGAGGTSSCLRQKKIGLISQQERERGLLPI